MASGPGTETGIQQVYQGDDFQAIGLDYWNGEPEQVRSYRQSTRVTYPLAMMASGTRSSYNALSSKDFSFVIDREGIIRYRGAGVDLNEITSVIDNLIVMDVEQPVTTPRRFLLRQNYPNPFNPSTTISFEIDRPQHIRLQIFDNRGRLVRTLLDNSLRSGPHSVGWDGRDGSGQPAASGVYLYLLKGQTASESRKMILIR